MKKILLVLALVLALVSPIQQATAVPIECADGYVSVDCLVSLVIAWVMGGPWDGDWEVGGHNWDY